MKLQLNDLSQAEFKYKENRSNSLKVMVKKVVNLLCQMTMFYGSFLYFRAWVR